MGQESGENYMVCSVGEDVGGESGIEDCSS